MSRERQRVYEKSEKGRASARERARRYRATTKGWVVQRRGRLRRLRQHYTNQLKELEDGTQE